MLIKAITQNSSGFIFISSMLFKINIGKYGEVRNSFQTLTQSSLTLGVKSPWLIQAT